MIMKTLYTTYNNFAKRLVMSLIVLMTVGVGSVLGETVTFDPSDFFGQGTSGTGSSISATKDGVTFSCNKGYGTTQFRCYKDGKITISSSKTISSISFSFSDSYTGGLETSYTELNTYSWEKSLSSQARITSCNVTYTTSGGGDDDDSGCITLSTTQNYPFNSTSSYNTNVYSTEIDGVTFENKGGYKYSDYLSFNKSLSEAYIANTTPFSGNIESIVVNYNSGGSAYFTMYEGSSSLPSSTIVSPSKTGTGEVTYTFSGNNAYFKFALTTTGEYCNISSITICCSTTPQTFTVTCNANGAESGDVPTDNQEYTSGASVTVFGNTGDLVKTGYRFDGWQINKAGTVYNAGGTFNISENTTLYAKWTARTLTNYRTSCGSAATLVSIAVSGQTTTYNVGDSFSFDGTCTATYDDESTKTVTPTSVSSPDMSTAGKKTVTVTYTEGDVTVTTEYDITVNVVKTATSLTWSADSYTATIASPSNLFPTLTINPEAIKGSVTYSSSYPEYATIDAAGNIRLLAAGTTTITASYAGDEDYNASSDTYELTVEKSTNCRWEEVTINDIEYGDEVVVGVSGIGANGEAILYMLQDPQEAANPEVYQMNVSDLLGATNLNNTLIWNIRKRDDNNDNFTIYKNGSTIDRLAFITNYGVRVGGNNADSIFTLTSERYIKSISSNEYLRMYNISEWRHYSTNTIQSFVFYKKVCLPSNISRVTYSVGNGDTAPAEREVENNTSITLPSITTSLTCVNFVGWTDAASGYTHGTDKLYKAGNSYTVTGNVTLHAVYAAGGGYVLVTDEANLAAGDKVIIVATNSNVAMGADRGNNRGEVEITKVDNTITNIGESQILTLEAGTKSETFAFNTGSGYLYAASSSSNHLKTQATNNDNGSWTIAITNAGVATIKAQGTYTRNWLRYNGGNNPPIFSCYASGQSDVSIYKEDVAGYTTDPACVTYTVTPCTPTNGTISVDPTTVDPYGSTTVTFTPADGYMLQAVTVTSGTATVGAPSYTTSQISGGTVRITDIQSDIEVCATFVEIPYYKVTFVDMNNGNSTKIVSQSGFGADIQAPTTASDGCDATWTFIGWAPSNDLNGASEIPNGLVAPGGTISGSLITDNSLTYYSVYSNSSDGTPPFSIGKSGTYHMYALDGTTKYYATTIYNSNTLRSNNTNFESYPKATFKLDFDSNNSKYKIKVTTNTSEAYLYQPDTYDKELILDDDDLSNYSLFTIINGSETESYRVTYSYYAQESKYVNGQWVTESVLKTGNFGMSSQKFAGRADGYDVYFEPASEMHYYNASDCTDDYVTMSFHNPFGSSKAQLQYEVGFEADYYTNTSKKYVDVFPTLEYAGWTFIGWTAGSSYNAAIGDENLNDENSSASAPTQDIYKTGGGLSYYLGGDVTMYPVFTKFEDNEPFDMVNGGDYYIYYIADGDIGTSVDEYGAAQRIYAAEYDDYGFRSTQSCADASLFTFTKLPDGKWTIYDNTRNKYVYGVNNDNKLEDRAQTADGKVKFIKEWTIEVVSGNQVNAVSIDGYVLSAYSDNAVSGTFKNYADDNLTNGNGYLYHRVYVGTCTERVYSSNPTNKPTITLSGEPIVTSTQDQSIRAQGELSISATKLAANGTITLTSDNADVYFSTVKDANFTQATEPVASLPLYADEKGKLAMTTVYVHYKPAAVPTSNLDIQTVTITATTGTEGEEDYATAETTAQVRNLPANFVIAAKWGDNWYAMPANMDSQSSTEGWLIEVDDAANPTKAIAAPNTTKYGLKSVYTSNSTADRYEGNGESLVFVENVTEATPITNKTLYNGGDGSSSKTNIQVYAQYANYYSDQNQAPRYEWIPTTTDLTDYTLTSGAILTGDAVGRTVSLDNHGVFGTLLQDKSYNGMVRLLPVDNFYGPAELQVVEWKQNSVSIMYTGAGSQATTKVGSNKESDVQLLSDNKIDHAVYSLATTDLTAATNQPLIIYIKNDANATIGSIKLTIPAIVATDKSSIALGVAEENAKATSIVVLEGATLTAATTKYTYDDITVYPGGKLVIGQNGQLGMYSLTLRAGSSWGAAEYENKYPQLLVRGDYSNTSGQINLDYMTTQDYYYPLSVPEQVTIDDIKYPVDIYGSNVDKANKGSFRLKYYDGAQRVTQGSQYGTGWVVVNEDETKTLTPNQGYAIWGIPTKINGTRQKYGIHRIPIKKAAADLITNETNDEKIDIIAHGDASTPPNDRGWNYLGNPYLVGLGSMDGSNEDLLIGLLEKEMVDGKWTGGWVYNEESVNNNVRYITITNDCQTFEAKPVAEAQIPPFTTFFIQAASVDKPKILLTAPASVLNVSSLPARHYAAQQETAKEITTGIILTGNDQTDRTGLLIADNFTEEYDFNADLSKFENSGINLYTIGKDGKLAFMAINQALAEQPIPLGYSAPADGEYTIAFDEDRYNATDINALYLIDYDRNEKTNLLHTEYSFVTAAGTNNERFALQVAFIPQNATSVEWVDDATIQVAVDGNNLLLNNLPTDAGVQVFDALGRVIYATPNAPTEMQITLPTGYYLVRIADKQHAVVINTVIP